MTPQPKYQYYRNPKILAAARNEACTSCGRNDGTTVAAHSNGLSSGKGIGLKGDDSAVAYLCFQCHSDYDLRRGRFAKSPERELRFYEALLKTQKIWLHKLLPAK